MLLFKPSSCHIFIKSGLKLVFKSNFFLNSVFPLNVFFVVYFCFYEDLESTQLAALNIILFIEYLQSRKDMTSMEGFQDLQWKWDYQWDPLNYGIWRRVLGSYYDLNSSIKHQLCSVHRTISLKLLLKVLALKPHQIRIILLKCRLLIPVLCIFLMDDHIMFISWHF